jgi:deazaflavin-dependent oxidoreductase (nitroreductase family)
MGIVADLGIRPVSSSWPARSVRWFASTRFGAWSLSGTLRHLDRWMLRISVGRTTISDLVGGTPTIFLTTTGARSGLPRTAQLIAVPQGDDLVVIGSNFGRPRAPSWVTNLAAHPQAVAAHGRRRAPVIAEEVVGAEADRIMATAGDLYRGFATYPEMASGRVIRVFRLRAGG